MPTLDLGGGETLSFEEKGGGRPIVLIHGALVTHTDWPDRIVDELARSARVRSLTS